MQLCSRRQAASFGTKMCTLLDRTVVEPLRQVPIAPVLAKGLALLTVDDRHQQLLDRLIQGLMRLVAEKGADPRAYSERRVPGGCPAWWTTAFIGRFWGGSNVPCSRWVKTRSSAAASVRRAAGDWMVQLKDSPRGDRAGRGDQAAGARSGDQRPPGRITLAG